MNNDGNGIRIVLDDLEGEAVRALLREHLDGMYSYSPPESVHALDLEALKHPTINFWTAWTGDELMGCAALKSLDNKHGEVKSMRTVSAHLRKGVAARMLQHVIDEARSRGYTRLSLETGTAAFFDPARRLYERFGFEYCEPFADYVLDPYSVFMTRSL